MTVLKEGVVGGALNLYFIYKFLRILTTPFASTEAFKLGIIDEKGKILKKKSRLKTIEEKEAYTMMHRLVWKLKRLMEKVPFGKTRLASYAAALWLIKEENEFDGTDQELQESFLSFLETDWESDALILKENYEGDLDKKTFSNLREDHMKPDKKGHNLPPHLAKFFDKKGNLKKDAADRIRKGRKQRGVKITDRTPDWMFGEEAPPGWEGVVKAMKKKKNIDNPYALAWHMHNKGMKPHIPEELGGIMEEILDEKRKSLKNTKDVGMECQECGKKFRAKLSTLEYGRTKCPKCKSTDLDFQFGEEVEIEDEGYGGTAKRLKAKKKLKAMGMTSKKNKVGGYVEEVELDEANKKARNKAADEIDAIANKGGAEAPTLFSLASKLRKGTHSTTGLKLSKPVASILKKYGIKEELDEVFNVGRMKDEVLLAFINKLDPDERMGQAAAMKLKAAKKEARKRGLKVEADEKLVYKLKIKPKKVKKFKDLRLYAKSPSKKKSSSSSPHVPAFGISRKGGYGAGHGYGKRGGGPLMFGEDTAPGEPEDKIAEKIYSILAKNGIKNPEFREGNLYVPKKDVKKANVVLKKAGMLKHFNGLIGEAKYYNPSARDLKDYERWAKTQKAIGPRPVLDIEDIEQWTMEIYKGIKAGWKSVGKSTLGGDENVAIMIKVTVEPEKEWPNKILQNASYGMIRIATDGTMQMFASGHKLKNMRKTKIKTPRDIIKKINDWIKSVSEEIAPHAKVMAKQGDSAKKIKAMHPEITDDELKDLGVSETVTTFKNFITEGRPALDPDYVPPRTTTDAMRAKLLSTQQKLYSAKDIESMARKYKVKLDGPPVGGKSWDGDWEIALKNGINLSYEYGKNMTNIKGWKFKPKAIKKYIGKYGNHSDTPRDYAPMGGKVLVGGLEAAFEVISEEAELNERKYNWAVIDTADKNRVQALTSDEKGARDSVKSSTISKHDYHYGKDPKTLKVVKLKKAHKDNDIGDPLKEEAPTNSVASGNVNLDPHLKKLKRKNAKVQTETFAGQKVFVVAPERFYDSRLGKSRYLRYEKFVGNDKLGEAIRKYGRENPKSAIILKNSVNGAMLYLKYGRK